MLDILLGVITIFLSGILIVCLSAGIQGLIFRWIGSSYNSENRYRDNQKVLDILFGGISIVPSLITSYYWGAYLIAYIFETLSGYAPPYTAIGTTIVMLVILVLFAYQLQKIRHKMLEESRFREQ